MVRSTDHPDMTVDVYRVRKTTTEQQHNTCGNHFSIVVHLPERTEMGRLTGSDETIRAVRSCNNWL